MKILIYSLNFSPELTATGKYTGELARWLASRGHEVSAVVGMPHYPQWSLFAEYYPPRYMKEHKDGVNILRVPHYIPPKLNVNASSRIKMDLSFIRKSLKYWLSIFFSKNRYDVVVLICPPLFTAFYPMLYKFFRRVPWVLHVQDIQIDVAVDLGLIKNRFVVKMLCILEKRVLKSAAIVSTISKSMKRKLEKKIHSNNEVLLIKNWADPGVINSKSMTFSFRDAHGIPRDKYLVLYAGNLGNKQGIEIVVDVAEQLSLNTEIQILVVGDGAAKDDIVTMAERKHLPNLKFLPVQDEVMLPDMLHEANLHLIIQKHETSDIVLPSKFANILASGQPCIVTACKGTEIEAIVSSNMLGVTVEPEDADALAQAINKRFSNQQASEEMGRKAAVYARTFLNMDATLRQFEKMLESIIVKRT